MRNIHGTPTLETADATAISNWRAYGSFSDSTTQTIASTTTAYPITFNTDDAKYLITHSTVTNPSRITVDQAGTYLIIYSAVFDMTAGSNQSIEIWLAVDGTNVANSNSVFTIATASVEYTGACSYIYTFTAGQYFELVMRGSSTNVQLLNRAAGASPTRPAIPSIICTINKV